MTPASLDVPFDSLADELHGDLLRPGEDGAREESYEEARELWNARIDRHPAAIARCSGAADVLAGVRFAREHGLPVSAKGGGHHVSGSALRDDGLVLDLGPMDAVRVDPDARTARVGAGATWGRIDHETGAFGLAVPGGQDPNIGVAGLTLGGGVGWLSREYGLTSDNLRSADVVTADGEIVRASETENPELFWALRGGGVNLGVVTSFEFDLYEVSEVFAGSLIYPPEETARVARRYREFTDGMPREARVLFGSMVLPERDVYPASVRGSRVAILVCFYDGSPEEGGRVFDPLRGGDPVMDSLRERPYTAFQRAGDSGGSRRTYLRSQYLETLSEAAVGTVVGYASEAPSAGATVFVSPRGGAETDPAPDATAYPHRDAAHHLLVEARWDDPDADEEHVDWVRRFHEALAPHTTGDVPVNFLTEDEDESRVRAAYGGNYDRLAEVKAEWDPEDLFDADRDVSPEG